MRNLILAIVGLVVVLGAAGAWMWSQSVPVDTDADDTLVHWEKLPADFPLAPLPAAEGELVDVTVRNLPSTTTITAMYALADGVDEDAILERYGKVMASEKGTPVRNGNQVRANVERGMMAAQIVDGETGRMLTLVAVRTP